jgi:hypothetical protein
MMERSRVYELIDGERAHQDRRWPGHAHSVTEYLVYIRDYVEDALHRVTHESGENGIKPNVRKIAALAVACMEEHGAPTRIQPPHRCDVEPERRCVACGQLTDELWACGPCSRKYPPSLLKAAGDTFEYALQTKTGDVIRFYTATIHGDFCTLVGGPAEADQVIAAGYRCPRGINVRIADIVWCADNPWKP